MNVLRSEVRAPSESPGNLIQLDALAAKLVERAAPIRFAVAQSSAEREAVYKLRCRVVVEKGWGSAADFPDGEEKDSFDERAIQLVGWDGNTIVASGRIVFPIPGQVLPTEKTYGLKI